MKSIDEYEKLTIQWSNDRGIISNSTDASQTLKLISEAGELCDNINKGRDAKDDIGDCLVCLTNIAAIRGYTLAECWEVAFNDIKDRKGYMNKNGVFIKESDTE